MVSEGLIQNKICHTCVGWRVRLFVALWVVGTGWGGNVDKDEIKSEPKRYVHHELSSDRVCGVESEEKADEGAFKRILSMNPE